MLTGVSWLPDRDRRMRRRRSPCTRSRSTGRGEASHPKDLDGLRDRGRIHEADVLTRTTGQQFHATAIPQYFTGNLSSRLVLVHLNPKQSLFDEVPSRYGTKVPIMEQYINLHTHFGVRIYCKGASRTHRSPFDHKQIRFLRPFGLIDFVSEDGSESKWINLERVIDRKLQLEVIPYQSTEFRMRGMTPEVLDPHWRQLLDTLVAVDRDYIIFCGRVLAPTLENWIVRRHHFRLKKDDGGLTRSLASFHELRVPYGGLRLKAGFAPTFAQRGIPMDAYGAQCAALSNWS